MVTANERRCLHGLSCLNKNMYVRCQKKKEKSILPGQKQLRSYVKNWALNSDRSTGFLKKILEIFLSAGLSSQPIFDLGIIRDDL